MTQDDVLFGYRLQLFALAGESGVSQACRLMGVHRSTYYRWKAQVERAGLEMLRPRERRRPRMPNQLSPLVEQRIVAFALGHPGLGPRRIAARLARPEWGGLVISPTASQDALPARTEHARQAPGAGRRLPRAYEPPREPPARAAHQEHPARRAGRHRLLLTSDAPRHHGHGLAVHRDRHLLQLRLGRSRSSAHRPGPASSTPVRLARRVAAELRAAGWQLGARALRQRQRVPQPRLHRTVARLDVRHTKIRAGRPQTNGHVERLHRTILEECWRPAFARFLQVRFTGL